jgi:hypothetical protein
MRRHQQLPGGSRRTHHCTKGGRCWQGKDGCLLPPLTMARIALPQIDSQVHMSQGPSTNDSVHASCSAEGSTRQFQVLSSTKEPTSPDAAMIPPLQPQRPTERVPWKHHTMHTNMPNWSKHCCMQPHSKPQRHCRQAIAPSMTLLLASQQQLPCTGLSVPDQPSAGCGCAWQTAPPAGIQCPTAQVPAILPAILPSRRMRMPGASHMHSACIRGPTTMRPHAIPFPV